jgi:5-methylcytosine-specific restriction endonuclease McrA
MDTQTQPSASAYSLDHVSNSELHLSTRRLVGRSNQILAALLAHLGEIEARGIHRERACASLHTYLMYELRMSEDAAFRRARAARLCREFPVILEHIAAGEIHLTALLLLGPHLTEENHRELLARAKHRTKREVLHLVRRVAPEPDVPASVEPLGPPPVGVPIPKTPTWQQFIEAISGPVRELGPGDRPKEWITNQAPEDDSDLAVLMPPATPQEPPALPPAPERYKVQFTASQEYVDLLQEAKDLASHALPNGSIEQLHLQAMRLLVAELKKRRCAEVKRPRATVPQPRQHQRQSQRDSGREGEQAEPRQRQREQAEPRQCQRESVRADVRREVWQRDGARCTYTDSRGQRCRETAFLELHHVSPHALGGPPTAANLTLCCHAHNALAAEQDFGRDFMQAKREAWGRGGVP